MPRRKQSYINRSRAQKFQLVQTADPNAPDLNVFVPLNEHAEDEQKLTNQTQQHDQQNVSNQVIDVKEWGDEWKRKDWELGEFGFPDDGYDYGKHFRRIGGSGGVFVDKMGKQRPDQVEGSSNWKGGRRQEDVDKEMEARGEIWKERRKNEDVDEVFRQLDSDGELDEEDEEEDEGGMEMRDVEEEVSDAQEGQVLEDDFVALADVMERDEEEAEKKDQLEGVRERYRTARLLDEQFDKFMNEYRMNSDDEGEWDDDEDVRELIKMNQDDQVELEEMKMHLSGQEIDGLFGEDGELVEELEGLKIETETENMQGNEEDMKREERRLEEFERFRDKEFEDGMERVMDLYKRVPGEEALEMFDGVNQALDAVKRNEQEEEERYARKEAEGLREGESDGADSELDTLFDEMYKQKEEKWDCETIVSTYTNMENHPSVIDAPSGEKRRNRKAESVIRLDARTQGPVGYVESERISRGRRDDVDFGTRREMEGVERRKGESKEEKRERKRRVKERARERRALKSEMRKAFGEELGKQNKHESALGKGKVVVRF